MTRIFALTNHKGGVGKSTSATHIAFGMVGLLRRAGAPNNRVLLIDTDSQGHASAVTNDFYRQVLELDLRNYSSEVLVTMGGIGRMHFSRYKALLKLSDDAIELADRYNIDEKKLRYVVVLSNEYHTELVR
jgi:cellulose biosynthesis protein BcsQ